VSDYNYAPKRASGQTIREKREAMERANLESAALILREADKFGNDNSIAVRWAKLFFANRGTSA
jgi:hypothetical protein